MRKEVVFHYTEIKKWKFHHHKNLILLQDVDIDNIQVSAMVSSGKWKCKYFIGWRDDDDYRVKPLRILLPIRRAYVKNYDGDTKWMNLLIKVAKLLKYYTVIWNKVSSSIKKNLVADPSAMGQGVGFIL